MPRKTMTREIGTPSVLSILDYALAKAARRPLTRPQEKAQDGWRYQDAAQKAPRVVEKALNRPLPMSGVLDSSGKAIDQGVPGRHRAGRRAVALKSLRSSAFHGGLLYFDQSILGRMS